MSQIDVGEKLSQRTAETDRHGVTVDFYYSIGSRYSYLAASQIDALERDTGCHVEWHPLNSHALITGSGRNPFDGAPVSGQYDWSYRERDARRWAAFYG